MIEGYGGLGLECIHIDMCNTFWKGQRLKN